MMALDFLFIYDNDTDNQMFRFVFRMIDGAVIESNDERNKIHQ